MKAKVILYGWALSWLFLFAGIGTMEHGSILAGSLLCSVWFFFSYMLIGNEAACLCELDTRRVSLSVRGPRNEGGIPDSSVRQNNRNW